MTPKDTLVASFATWISPPRSAIRPLPFLFVLRLLCGLHLLIAALLPSDSFPLFSASAPVQVPFLLLLSGFCNAYVHASSRRWHLFSATRFYVRRFALLYPLYVIVVLIHALAFSSSSLPLLRFFTAASGLTPWLPKPLAFAPHDAPLLSYTLLPCLALGYLVFPVLLDIFPRYDTAKRVHLFYVTIAVWATTVFQSFWLSHLPNTAESGRLVMLVDILAYVPFLGHLPAFAAGMLLALLFLSNAHVSTCPPPSYVARLRRVAIAAISLLVLSRLLLPLRLEPNAADGTFSFASNFVICGALLPPFAALVWACASLSYDDSRLSAATGRTEPSFDSLLSQPPMRHAFAMDTDAVLNLSSFGFTLYVLAAPVWRSLGFAMCRSKRGAAAKVTASSLRNFVCMNSGDMPSLMAQPSEWLSWWPWVRDRRGDLTVTNAAAAAASRLASTTVLEGPGVNPMVYIPVLLTVGAAVYLGIQSPLAASLMSMHERLLQAAEDGRLAYSSLSSRVAALLITDPNHGKPRRNNSEIERVVRVLLYYIAGASFLYFVFHFSLTISLHLTDAKSGSLFCWLPSSVFSCDENPTNDGPAGLLGKLGIGSSILTSVVDMLRWVSLLTLPTMILNVLGHIVFPRAIWKRLPTIPEILEQRRSVDEEMQLAESAETVLDEPLISRHQNGSDENMKTTEKFDLDFIIFIRYVTRGNSPRLVANNVRRAAEVLVESGLPKDMWRVEVVTDNELGLAKQIPDPAVYEIVVPTSYRPPNGALYKARALNYAITASPARQMDWIVHLDEETCFDGDTVRAMLDHCGRETYLTRVAKSQAWPRIGQGPILYGRAMTDTSVAGGDTGSGNWLTTLADSGRVSDDCGRYRVQFECGEVWVGMHGSFVIAANCVEQEVTFDHGVEGSIAEDAFFAMLARSRDVRFAWIDALMFEQSPFTIMDFIKQRSRWLVGGLRVVASERIPLRLRILMKVLTGLWALMPLTYTALFVSILFGSGNMEQSLQNQYYYEVLIPLLAAVSLWNYVFGFFVTFSMRRIGVVRFLTLLYMQVVLAPVFGLMEVGAVSYGLWNFAKLSVGFHIVEKDVRMAEETSGGETRVADAAGEMTRLV